MNSTLRVIFLGTTIFVGAAGWASALADDSPTTPADGSGWVPVSEQTLDETRGGFDVGNGLMASFGINRAVYVNGNLVTQTSFNVPDIARMTTTQASAMSSALNAMSITQIGPNNTFDPSSLGQTSAGAVIQNTLNNQNIQSVTTLNTSVNSLNAFRSANFQDALQQAQLQSLVH
ncbi:hypothetical protein [Dyella telluris]|uniref:Uncharacterized protein n=1 Tax=Dyella telluris TaxID=2763498 RepID=A0A7G8Q5E4_9GAMM|nr:hypothetical protein [Dyella telluris]QNK02002.1 hypothetical protein H8F01_02205 [Dyella telluris]